MIRDASPLRRLLLGWFLLVATAYAAQVVYIYDELGRLAAVVDPATDTAIYSYDAVGNITAIARRPSSTLGVINFSPGCAGTGTTVLIYGTGFKTTTTLNTVKFNGITATVTAATATQLTVTVPATATTGTISVTTTAGTATSTQTFTIGCKAPTITSFTPANGVAATAVTLTGTNFDPTAGNNTIVFNTMPATVGTATATSLATTVPDRAQSGKITVTTPYGSAVSTNDFIVPPAGTTIATISSTARVGAFGTVQNVTVGTAGNKALLLFDGTTGRRISIKLAPAASACWQLKLLYPNGAIVGPVSNGCGTNTVLQETTPLPLTGTYTVIAEPTSSTTGTAAVTVYDFIDPVAPIVIDGASVPVAIGTPGMNARFTFDGTAGQMLSLVGTGVTYTGGTSVLFLRYYDPFGIQYNPGGGTASNPALRFRDVLPVTGRYQAIVDPDYNTLTTMTGLTLYSIVDVTGTTTLGGTVNTNLAKPSTWATYTFPTTVANQRVSVLSSGGTLAGHTVYIKDGSGTWATALGVPDSNILVVPLGPAGTYTLEVHPTDTSTGTKSFTLYAVPADPVYTTTINGTAQVVTTVGPGQNATVTFPGTAGGSATVRFTNTTYSSISAILKAPDGTWLSNKLVFGTPDNLPATSLPQTGTYTVVVDPTSTQTGSITVAVTNP